MHYDISRAFSEMQVRAFHRYVYRNKKVHVKGCPNPQGLKTPAVCDTQSILYEWAAGRGARGAGARAAARDVSSGAPLPRLARVVGADHLRLRHAAALLLRKREPICPHTQETALRTGK